MWRKVLPAAASGPLGNCLRVDRRLARQRGHDDLAPRNGLPGNAACLLSLGLVLYAGWHFTKAAFFRPESPFDWTPVERDLLLAMPLRRRDLVAYQLASVPW